MNYEDTETGIDLTAALHQAYEAVTTPPEGTFCVADIQKKEGIDYDAAFAAVRRMTRAGLAKRVAKVGGVTYYRLCNENRK